MKIKNLLKSLTATAAMMIAASAAQASILPSGVQNDVAVSTVSGWGFTVCSVVNFSTNNASSRPAAMLAGCSGDYLMMASRRIGSSTFDVLAAANFADVIFEAGTGNVTHLANHVEWYFNDNWSWGFAGEGDQVLRTSADVAGAGERDRLSWHTHDTFSAGYRSGNFISNNSTGWEKVLLVANATQVPEPESVALFGAALAGLALGRRRKSARKAA